MKGGHDDAGVAEVDGLEFSRLAPCSEMFFCQLHPMYAVLSQVESECEIWKVLLSLMLPQTLSC